MRRFRLGTLLALSLLSSGIAAFPAGAQSIWLPRDRPHGVLLEVLHNRLEFYDSDFPAGTVYLGGRFALGVTTAFVGEVSYTRVEATRSTFYWDVLAYDGKGAGNPYLGIEWKPNGSDFFAELGARAPTMKKRPDDVFVGDAAFVASRADQGRFDAFARSTLPIHLVFNVRHVTDTGLLTRLRFGPVVTIPTEDDGFRDIELHAVFGWQIGYEGKSARVGGALTGQSPLTANYPPLGQRTRSQFEFHADFGSWAIRPGFDVRLPIGTYADLVSVAYGGSLVASF